MVHQVGCVIPRPTGEVKAKGSAMTTASYATIVEITVTKNRTFHPAKIVVSCPEDVVFKLRWAGSDIGPEYYVMAKLPFTDWFPMNYHPCVGDGAKKFDLQAKYPPGGTGSTVHAEIAGEEV